MHTVHTYSCTYYLLCNFSSLSLYRPAIVVLLMSMVNEKQPFPLRCAVLYCFQSFLYKNEVGQSQIVTTLLPTSSDGESVCLYNIQCTGVCPVCIHLSANQLFFQIMGNLLSLARKVLYCMTYFRHSHGFRMEDSMCSVLCRFTSFIV